MKALTMIRPDDWHLHLRDGELLAAVLPHTVRQFARAIVMPNLSPPITTVDAALAYRDRILAAAPEGVRFGPLMTLYLTDNTTTQDIAAAQRSDAVHAVKYYPAGATTNADSGVTDIEKTFDALHAMDEAGLPLLVHGEVTDPEVDVFDREQVFVERVLAPLAERFETLKIVLEHVSTMEGVEFVANAREGVAATITAHHLLYNRNAMFEGGLRPHRYCLPVLKKEPHRAALMGAATGDSGRFFLGTDSAPHPAGAKQSDCGCAGIYTAHAALELYAEVFDSAARLQALEGFASRYGPQFYGLPVNDEKITLIREPWSPPPRYPAGNDYLIPLRADEPVAWRLRDAAA